MTFDQTWRFRNCPWCGLRDAQFNLLSADLGAEHLGTGAARWWSVMSCPRCAGVVVIETSPPNATPEIRITLPDEGAEVRIAHLPPDVAAYYSAAVRVLEAGVPDAAAVQLRRTLEAAAAHRGVAKGPLVQRIERLIEDGLITTDFGKVLDHIREVGNVGAHAGDARVDEETARRALRFTTQVLRNLFEIPAELEAIDSDNDEPSPEV